MYEFLCFLGNLLHFMVCCKCIVCPKRSELLPSRPNVQVRQNVPQRPQYVISSDFEDDSTYNDSSTYGVPPVTSQPKTVKHINPSGVTVSAKSLTVAKDEQFMHAVKVDFTCEVKGRVEVGGVPKEVKGMISIINNDDNSQIVSAVNTNLTQQSEEDYLEPIAVSNCVKITKRIGPLPDVPGRGADEGYESEKYGPYSSKVSNITEQESENLYEDIIEDKKETPKEDIPSSSYHDSNSSNYDIKENKKETPKVEDIPSSSFHDTIDSKSSISKTDIKNKLETILSRQLAKASSMKKEGKPVVMHSEVKDDVRKNKCNNSDDSGENIYENPDVDNDSIENISLCSSWSSDEFDEPIYGNNEIIVKNLLENTVAHQSSSTTDTNKEEEVPSTPSNKVYNMVQQIERNPSKSGTRTLIPLQKAETIEEYNNEHINERYPSKSVTRTLIPLQKTEKIEDNDENIYEDIVINGQC